MNTYLVDDVAGFEALKEEWDCLFETIGCSNPFVSFDWLFVWWKYFQESQWQLHILAFKDQNGTVGIAPFYFQPSAFGGRKFQLLGTGRSDFPGVLVGQENRELVFDLMAKSFKSNLGKKDLLDVHEVVEGETLSQLKTAFSHNGFHCISRWKDQAPYLSTNGITWEEYLGLQGKKFRKAMKKKEKRLLSKGDVTVTRYDSWECQIGEFSDGFELASAIERKSWKFFNGSERINTNETSKRWFKELLDRFSNKGWLDFWVYTLDGEPRAYAVNFNVNGGISAYNSAYDEEVAESGPGALMHIFRIRDAFEKNLHTYHFLRGKESYKYAWTKNQELLHQVVLTKDRFNLDALLLRFRWWLAKNESIKSIREKLINLVQKMRR